jgi:hypothetical protein
MESLEVTSGPKSWGSAESLAEVKPSFILCVVSSVMEIGLSQFQTYENFHFGEGGIMTKLTSWCSRPDRFASCKLVTVFHKWWKFQGFDVHMWQRCASTQGIACFPFFSNCAVDTFVKTAVLEFATSLPVCKTSSPVLRTLVKTLLSLLTWCLFPKSRSNEFVPCKQELIYVYPKPVEFGA